MNTIHFKFGCHIFFSQAIISSTSRSWNRVIVGTASQSIYDYKILNGSTESFLVQILFESGAIILCIFLIFFFWCLFKCYNTYNLKPYAGILVASLFVMIGTPAFYGFVNPWLWAILIYISSERKNE